MPFSKAAWYRDMIRTSRAANSRARYDALVSMHTEAQQWYARTIATISVDQAAHICADGRTVAQVVAHIMSWEEWSLEVLADPGPDIRLAMFLRLEGFIDPLRLVLINFGSVDEFNAYTSQVYAEIEWEQIQTRALASARHLREFFSENPREEFREWLESTPQYQWSITPQIRISVPSGIYLWMVSLVHERVEHLSDLTNPELS